MADASKAPVSARLLMRRLPCNPTNRVQLTGPVAGQSSPRRRGLLSQPRHKRRAAIMAERRHYRDNRIHLLQRPGNAIFRRSRLRLRAALHSCTLLSSNGTRAPECSQHAGAPAPVAWQQPGRPGALPNA
jgi:hypothetical protein